MYLFDADHVFEEPAGKLSAVMNIVAAGTCMARTAPAKIPKIAERLRNMLPPVLTGWGVWIDLNKGAGLASL
jgi:hypothetical protein